LDQAPVVQVGLEVGARVEMVHQGVRRVMALLAQIQGEVVVDRRRQRFSVSRWNCWRRRLRHQSSSSTQYLLKPYLHLSHRTVWTAPTGVTAVDYLVVAGGGGGGASGGGGAGAGGAGGFRTGTGRSVTEGTSYTVTVGAGGAGGTANSESPGTRC
jgi:hypothetical protein